VCQARKRFGLAGALAAGWRGWGDRLAMGRGVVVPQPVEHEEEPHQCNKPELVEKESWYHGMAPADDSEMRALYWTLGLIELSAVERYTTETLHMDETARRRVGAYGPSPPHPCSQTATDADGALRLSSRRKVGIMAGVLHDEAPGPT
jgi:hypothetical protein